MAEHQEMVVVRRGDLDRIRLVLAAAAYLAACALRAAGRWPEEADRWLAPAFFAVAGFAAVPAFRGRSTGEWVVAKVLRLFVPAVVGMLLFAVPLFLLRRPGEVDEWAGHLWFLPALLAVSLTGMPLLALLERRAAGPRALAAALSLPVVLPAGLAAILGSAPWAAWVVSAGACASAWALGAMTASGPSPEGVLARQRWPTLIMGLALAAAAGALGIADAASSVRTIVAAAAAGSLAPAALALGLRRTGAAWQVPTRLNDWVLSFFMFSRPAFLAVGRAMAGLPIGATLRVALAAALAAAITLAACEISRRPVLLRFLTGLRERSDAS